MRGHRARNQRCGIYESRYLVQRLGQVFRKLKFCGFLSVFYLERLREIDLLRKFEDAVDTLAFDDFSVLKMLDIVRRGRDALSTLLNRERGIEIDLLLGHSLHEEHRCLLGSRSHGILGGRLEQSVDRTVVQVH